MSTAHDTDRGGVRIPSTDGRRSSSGVGTRVLAESLAGVNDDITVAATTDTWRRSYREVFAASTREAVSATSSVQIAEQGLASLHSVMMHTEGGDEAPLSQWSAARPMPIGPPVETLEIQGEGERVRRLEVPYRGRVLHGQELVDQLHTWVAAGVVEPGFATAVTAAVNNPEWLSLPGHSATLIGAGAAMGPLESLSRWGADIVAVDVPVGAAWDRVSRLAAQGSGTLRAPSRGTVPGLHVAADLATLRPWLLDHWAADTRDTVLGIYAYADGAAHVEAAAAADVLVTDLWDTTTTGVVAFLNTPTDTFLVPDEVIDHSRASWADLPLSGRGHRLIRAATGRRLFRPAYEDELSDELGKRWSVIDTLVDVQGPNYALAKRVHRWRATVAHHEGRRLSTTVAPASWTRSVTKNKVLASVYAGAHHFDVEIFHPETAGPLLAAKLVADVHAPTTQPGDHPELIFSHDAAHGGLWRQPFDPASALGLAALMGAPATLAGRR